MSETYIDVDTAVALLVNKMPLIDDTDFKTREESIAYNAAGMDLVWNFTSSAGVVTQTAVTPTTAGVHDWLSKNNGSYTVEIPASAGTINNDSEGSGFFSGICTGVLAWISPTYTFRAAALNDALIDGGDTLDVAVTATGLDAVLFDSTFALAIAKALWSDTLTAYTNGMAGKRVKGITAVPTLEGTIDDAAATTTSCATTLTGYGDGFFDDALFIVEIAADQWQGRPVASYTSATGVFTFDEAFISAPANTSAIAVKATHIHPVTEIREEIDANSTQLAAILSLLDDARGEPGQGNPPVNPDLATKIDYLYKNWRNLKKQSATTFELYNDAGSTVDQKATASEAGSVVTKTEIVTGP